MANTIPVLDRLKSQLLTSGLQEKNQALFQIINQLVDAVKQNFTLINDEIDLINDDSGNLTLKRLLILKGYTVATLPAGKVGAVAYCTDLLAPAYLAVAAGGGAVIGPVFFDGTNWVTI